LLLLFDVNLFLDMSFLFDGILKFFLQTIQSLNSFSGVQFQSKKFFISFINILDMLFVFNLKLMEINELKLITHLFFMLDLGVSLEDLSFKRNIL